MRVMLDGHEDVNKCRPHHATKQGSTQETKLTGTKRRKPETTEQREEPVEVVQKESVQDNLDSVEQSENPSPPSSPYKQPLELNQLLMEDVSGQENLVPKSSEGPESP